MTGDLVMKEPLVNVRGRLVGNTGMVIGVSKANAGGEHLGPSVYPFVYYVYFLDGKVSGPLFQSELTDA